MNSGLYPPVFRPLQMKEIKPEGWLLNQLKIQAAGLSGNLDKFWPDIKDSAWIGGAAEGWERVPYWLDGFIPLAWLLDDEDMKIRANHYIDYIISHQSSDGWICPESGGNRQAYDVWALFLILKVLVLYHDAAGDSRIEEVVRKALLGLERHIDGSTLFSWGQTRWYEGLISIWWLYERTGEEWLLNLAVKLNCQGFDWFSFFKHWPYKKPDARGRWSQMSHVVNNAMMLKAGALLWRLTGTQNHLDAAEGMVDLLDEYHGMVTGVFTGDECLAGTSPVQGTELCAVGEYMYSLEHLVAVTGRAHWGDRLEKIAYNALPATLSPDMWTHQYDQQVNQVECSRQENPVFTTNSGESHLFGLEPNYGCCTANLSQPWPKLAFSVFMRSTDGLAVVVYAPCSVNTCIGDAKVAVTLETGYPFRDTMQFKVQTDREADFAFWLRIPAWAKGAVLEIDNQSIPVENGNFHHLKRKWVDKTSFTLRLPMEPCLESRPNGLFALARGPLVYSLPIGERWVRINEDKPGREHPHCDFEIFPTTLWNYGLCLDKESFAASLEFEEYPIGDCPFSPAGAPVTAHVKGRKVDWSMENGSAAPYPGLEWVSEEVEELTLIPYGCTNLRMTEMPMV
ncbi:MAG: glycoside hydrolase family 127 protein [Clostridiales bacterium]|nr:glycoside hydrolase family 127 protein [Clostridiales bacterium]